MSKQLNNGTRGYVPPSAPKPSTVPSNSIKPGSGYIPPSAPIPSPTPPRK